MYYVLQYHFTWLWSATYLAQSIFSKKIYLFWILLGMEDWIQVLKELFRTVDFRPNVTIAPHCDIVIVIRTHSGAFDRGIMTFYQSRAK